jgi:hypothetical protein
MSKTQVLGRPKTLTYEQREINRKRSASDYKKNNKDSYNKKMREYNLRNREKIRATANAKTAAKRLIRNDPFYNGDNLPINDRQKKSLTRMSELISICCKEKKSKGSNYQQIINKNNHRNIMTSFGFTDEYDIWVSNSWRHIPLLILGWNDIKTLNDKKIKHTTRIMIIYGCLRWELNIPKVICKIIADYINSN